MISRSLAAVTDGAGQRSSGPAAGGFGPVVGQREHPGAMRAVHWIHQIASDSEVVCYRRSGYGQEDSAIRFAERGNLRNCNA